MSLTSVDISGIRDTAVRRAILQVVQMLGALTNSSDPTERLASQQDIEKLADLLDSTSTGSDDTTFPKPATLDAYAYSLHVQPSGWANMLDWQVLVDRIGAIKGIQVWRQTVRPGEPQDKTKATCIMELPRLATLYVDTQVDPDQGYYYWLRTAGWGSAEHWEPGEAQGGLYAPPTREATVASLLEWLQGQIDRDMLVASLAQEIPGVTGAGAAQVVADGNRILWQVQRDEGGQVYCAGMGVEVRAEWDIGKTYPQGSMVRHNGVNYVSLVADNLGNEPGNAPAAWAEASDQGLSEMVVLADAFKVYTSDTGATPVFQTFTNANGQPQVAISGDLIVDGSVMGSAIVADSLDVTTLVATGAVTAEKLEGTAATNVLASSVNTTQTVTTYPTRLIVDSREDPPSPYPVYLQSTSLPEPLLGDKPVLLIVNLTITGTTSSALSLYVNIDSQSPRLAGQVHGSTYPYPNSIVMYLQPEVFAGNATPVFGVSLYGGGTTTTTINFMSLAVMELRR